MLARTKLLTSIALFSVLPAVLATAKRGIAWPYFEQQGVSDVFSPSAISWVYDYETYTPRPQGSNYGGLQFFCMQGKANAPSSPIANLASNCASAGEYVMGFNEPDNYNSDGSGISPADAVQLWKQYFEPLRATMGKKLVAPAVTSSTENGKGLSWLDAFVGLCQGCHFDAFAFHPYAQDAAAVQGSIDYVASRYSPLWITEFGRDDSTKNSPGGADFIRSMINYLEAKPQVQRYAYLARFVPNQPNANIDLKNPDGSLTALGQVWNRA